MERQRFANATFVPERVFGCFVKAMLTPDFTAKFHIMPYVPDCTNHVLQAARLLCYCNDRQRFEPVVQGALNVKSPLCCTITCLFAFVYTFVFSFSAALIDKISMTSCSLAVTGQASSSACLEDGHPDNDCCALPGLLCRILGIRVDHLL